MAGILFLALALTICPHPISLLAAVIVHESGHVLAAALLGWGAPSLTVSPIGLKLSYHGAKSLASSVAVTLSGCIAGLLFSLLMPRSSISSLYSLGFALANLLPVFSLDGGGCLLAVLEAFMLPDRAFKIARIVSSITVVLLWVLSTAIQLKAGTNITLLAASVYLTVLTLSEGR